MLSRGWQVVKSASVPTVEDAYEIERSVLRWLRLEAGWLPARRSGRSARRPYTVSADDVAATDIWAEGEQRAEPKATQAAAASGDRSEAARQPLESFVR